MKIRSMQTCIMSSLPRCIFRCSVFRYVTLVSFFFLFFFVQTLLFNCNSFTLVANKYLLTYLFSVLQNCAELFRFRPICNIKFFGYLSRLLSEKNIQDIQSNVIESCFLFLNKHLRESPA